MHRSSACDVERRIFGFSVEGRPLVITLTGNQNAPVRMLIVAGQHGDEPEASLVASRFAMEEGRKAAVAVGVVACLNPDGAARGTRRNRRNLDLNRDHQRLRGAETRALHALVRHWRPHLVVDLHTYPPRRKHLLAAGLVYSHDVFVETATHPAAASVSGEALRGHLIAELGAAGWLVDRYTLVRRNGRIRHGTLDPVDLRNGLALRHLVPTALIEGRETRARDGRAELERVRGAMTTALSAAADWAALHARALTEPPAAGLQEVALRGRYRRCEEANPHLLAEVGKARSVLVQAPGENRGRMARGPLTRLPVAYAVPRRLSRVLAVLRRHALVDLPGGFGVADGASRLCDLHDHAVFPVDPASGPALAVWLEPKSRYGLWRFPELGLGGGTNRECPIVRLSSF